MLRLTTSGCKALVGKPLGTAGGRRGCVGIRRHVGVSLRLVFNPRIARAHGR
jgi:hypothetical protein